MKPSIIHLAKGLAVRTDYKTALVKSVLDIPNSTNTEAGEVLANT